MNKHQIFLLEEKINKLLDQKKINDYIINKNPNDQTAIDENKEIKKELDYFRLNYPEFFIF